MKLMKIALFVVAGVFCSSLHAMQKPGFDCQRTQLSKAALKGNKTEVSQELDKSDVNINHQNRFGDTPLMEAAEGGHLEVVMLLIAKKGDLNKQNKLGKTALHLALESLNTKASDDHCVDKKVEEKPLLDSERENCEAIISALICEGADVNIRDYLGNRPSDHWYIQRYHSSKIKSSAPHGLGLIRKLVLGR